MAEVAMICFHGDECRLGLELGLTVRRHKDASVRQPLGGVGTVVSMAGRRGVSAGKGPGTVACPVIRVQQDSGGDAVRTASLRARRLAAADAQGLEFNE